MKQILAFLLCFVMLFTLCACGTSTLNVVDPPEPGPAPVQPIKVGFIYLHDENSTYDLNFINAAKEAAEITGVEIINKVGIPEGNECYEAAADLADTGCSIIFADSFGHEDFLIQAAREYPNVQFCHATGTQAHTVNLPNFHNAFAAIYEGRYLAGVAAGLKLNDMIENGEFEPEDAVIGYVGAYPYAEVISGYTSFFLGARSVCPTATMLVQFTSTWYDESIEKEVTNNLIGRGCKLISQHADSMGAPSACENAGIPNVSYNGSTITAGPNTYIISSRINWVPYFVYMINCVQNREQIDTDWVGTIANGAVELTEINSKVATENTAEVIDIMRNQLLDGSLNVFDTSTWTVNGEHLESYMADVDTDSNYTPDTNVIQNGVFYESLYRSAPYFDITIDGIEILGN